MMRARLGLAPVLAVGLLFVSLSAGVRCAGPSPERVTVIASWIGDEGRDFNSVLEEFMRENPGIQVDYQGTRALNEVVLSQVQRHAAPDIAVSSPGELASYQREGALHPIEGALGAEARDYDRQWLLPLPKADSPHLYAVPIKANLKSIVWFDPAKFPEGEGSLGTWSALAGAAAGHRTTPWCMGMVDAPNSGWPGADWIQDAVLRQSGTAAYAAWASGRLPWTSPEVRSAWEFLGDLVTRSVDGGARAALLTDFGSAGLPMFRTPPGCYLEHQGSFETVPYEAAGAHPYDPRGTHAQRADAFDFIPLPSFGTSRGDATTQVVQPDLAAMFNDTDAARRLIHFLAGPTGQGKWPAIKGGGGYSVDKQVPLDKYPDAVSRKIAAALRKPGLCFDARNVMPPIMRDAFDRAVLEYLADPGRLEPILQGLEQVRLAVQTEPWPGVSCGGGAIGG